MNATQQLAIDQIVIRRRIRKDLGDLEPLVESLRRYGQLNPIVVTSQYELIAGHRRLESARRLGWTTVTVTFFDPQNPAENLELEIEENLQRRDLAPDELAEAYLRLEKLRNPGLWARITAALRRFFRRLLRSDHRRPLRRPPGV